MPLFSLFLPPITFSLPNLRRTTLQRFIDTTRIVSSIPPKNAPTAYWRFTNSLNSVLARSCIALNKALQTHKNSAKTLQVVVIIAFT